MILHTDIPTRGQVNRLFAATDPASISIYLPTEPASPGTAEQIALKNLTSEAARQLSDAGTPKSDIAAIQDQFDELAEDIAFWRHLARSLAVFATPESLTTYRLPNNLQEMVAVSDRFHLKPLLRSITFPQTAFVLALAQGSVRLLEVLPDSPPTEVSLSDVPSDIADAVREVTLTDRAPRGTIRSPEGQPAHMRSYARQIDQGLRPLLTGLDAPLILASAEPLDAVYRSVNTYPHLAAASIPGNPENTPDAELAVRARTILDDIYAAELTRLHELFGQRRSEGRAETDVANIARAATYGMVDTLLVDMDAVVPGFVDDNGAVTFADEDDAAAYGIVDEIARRTWAQGGTVLAVRRDDVPDQADLAAILRYAL